MGATATAINLSPGSWESSKPKDYKGKDLDAALKAYDEYRGKAIQLDNSKLTVTDVKAALSWLERKVAALEAIRKACDKTAGELRKAGKDSDYESAASFAEATKDVASRELGKTR